MTAPRFPAAGYALAAGVAVGLAATSLSAFAAFDAVMTFEHALAAALVVEAGAVVEAWALARARGFGDMALAGLAVGLSVLVSASYNFAQVQAAGAAHGVTDPLQLAALAYGPLAALVFFSLNFGRTVRRHDAEVAEWHKAKTHAAQSVTAQAARSAEQAAYDARRDAERNAQRAHELALAATQAASPQFALAGGDAQPASRKPRKSPATPSTAQLVAEWRERNPNGTRAECAAAIKRHPANVGRQWVK